MKNGCENDFTTASIYRQVGFILWDQENILGTVQNLYKAYTIMKTTAGEKNVDTCICYEFLNIALNQYLVNGDLKMLDPSVVEFVQNDRN